MTRERPPSTRQPVLQSLRGVQAGPGDAPVFGPLDLDIRAGLTAVTGDEGTGKTTLLRVLAGDLAPLRGEVTPVDAAWLDLRLPGSDELTPLEVWAAARARWPRWQPDLAEGLADALQLKEHLAKRLFMLSTGSRRKVALVALLASGATLTCLDQPFASLDGASVRVLREFLQDAAEHTSRGWVVADYGADPALEWGRVVSLDTTAG